VLDINSLGYQYDTTKPPRRFPVPSDPAEDDQPFGLAVGDYEPIAAASNVAVAQERSVRLRGGAPGDQAAGGVVGSHWVLRFDEITAARPALTSYQVYLGLEPNASADPTDDRHYAGLISLFGVFEASRDDGRSEGSGQSRRLEVSSLVAGLGPEFNVLSALVRLVPSDPDRDLDSVHLNVGRISLNVA
jgi:hypothetical protein